MFNLSGLAKEFISLLLQLEAPARMSAKAALAHRWQRQGIQHVANNQHAMNKNQHTRPWQRQGTQHALNTKKHANLDHQRAQPRQRTQHALNNDKHANTDNHHPSNKYQHDLTDNQHASNKNQHANVSTNGCSDGGHGEGQVSEDRVQELNRVSDSPSTSSSSSSSETSSMDHNLHVHHQSKSEHLLDQSCSKTSLQKKWTLFKRDVCQRFSGFNINAKAKCIDNHTNCSGYSATKTLRKPRFSCFWSSIKSSATTNKRRE